jgi:hypothetical protein
MTEADATPTPIRRAKRTLALVEAADSGRASSGETTAPPMAVSIAGVSTACSKDALRSSAEAVRRNLSPE